VLFFYMKFIIVFIFYRLSVLKFPLFLIKYHAFMTFGEHMYGSTILTSALGESKWPDSPHDTSSEETGSCKHFIRGYLGPRVGLDFMENRKITYLFLELNLISLMFSW
jgi:hypothetical protein